MPIIKNKKTENVTQASASRVSSPRVHSEKTELNTKIKLNEEKLAKKDDKKIQGKSVSGCPFKSVTKTSSRPGTSQLSEQKKAVKSCPFKSAMLNSYSDNRSFVETFHTKSVKGLGCSQKACRGSILKDGIVKLNQQKDPIVAISENIDFLNQYYEAINKKNSDEHKERLTKSESKCRVTGHYDLTFDELEFACRTAWRNAARCIGRINWSKIKLFDGRDCTTTKEMFEKLCDHIRFATNNGNLRSAITVFRQRIKDKPDMRIWNSQLINYAGYEISETETIGDKSQIEFTKICEKLGWKGKKNEFEVLPLVLQIGDQKPELYELPEDLVLQVDLVHPKYESFKDLKLKWYASPLVSSLVLDAGGIYYNCTAFNGWYMNTEIGRDLTEPNRFDKLRVIAKVLGLDMNTNVSLWKDEVLLELNKAILYSFNKAGVTIVDHHSASESFVKHWENELRIRGGTPADWIWINPPLTSHITPLFGMEMINYVVKPYFEYQEMPRLPKKSIKFKTLVKSVVPFLVSAYKKIKIRPKCCILYASQTGKSKNFSEITYNVFKNVFNAKLICINDYNLNDLDKENLVIAIASTTGNGDSPTNGKSIEEMMNKIKKKQITRENNEVLAKSYSHVRYSVLGFGDSTYCYNFGAYPKLIDSFYKYLGLTEVYPINIADQVRDEEKTMFTWLKNSLLASYTEFKANLSIKQTEIDEILGSKLLKTKKICLRSSPFTGPKSFINDATVNFSRIYEKNLKHFEIVEREVIGYQPNNQKILRIKLRSKGFDITFIPGNHVEIFGKNRKEYVDFILSRLNNNPNFDEPVKFEIFDERYSSAANELWLTDKKYPIMSIRQALSEYFDISKPLTQEGLKMLASQALNEKDRETLENLATDWRAYEDWKSDYPNLVDVLKTFFSVNPDINTLIAVLPHMKSRFYSISSSKKVATNEFDITIGVFQYESTVYDSIHYGVCSKFLEDAPIGTVIPGEIISGNKFTMPEDTSLPIIMICTGCGIAPFRSFWMERAREIEISKNSISNKVFGDFILLYGCREKQKDFLYMNEIETLKEKKVLTAFYTAYSRDPNYPKEYVQDKLEENAEEFIDLILNKNAHIYVCGRKILANEVIEKLRTIFSLGDKFDSMDAIDSYIQELKGNNRYHEDLFNS